ncbi:SusC/RagA family TonB-linked outer membrane protein [Zunongwangia sp. HRR-M8]|uniref:SusC/RagA family TonB-linked outer membrane protein n=1 Tax=Zunongwangia sp. HRR-M8 TaxID=3015170 RepID=UPI0022DD504A|nr:TonB-dependent receptor [Zunongwangia sp. HRR-M8]WBL21287.1 TonB-dependent receptor [Zunongwangia sp. HRR-M8]
MKTITKGILGLLCLLPIQFFAQEQVSGTVTEAATGMPVPGANVIVKGTSNGTMTDFDGLYTIENLVVGDTIAYSFLGFETEEIEFTGQNEINILLKENQSQLDEVVVVGYGTIRKKDATGAVNQVSTEDFNKGQVNTASQLITGKIAGVNVTSGGGAPGEGQNINIRGIGSISLNSSPLFVVDGIPLNNESIGGSRNPLDFINPNDIESMTVLKDASATAIYGSRAANGVIMITTKKGKGQEFKFNYSSATTLYRPTDHVDVLNAGEFRELVTQIGSESAIELLGDANTSWQDQIYKDAIGFEHNFSTTGNIGGFMPTRASVGYTDQDGILDSDNFSRTTASLSLRPSFMDGHLKVEVNARGMYTENTFANKDAIGASVDFDPTQPIYDEASPFGGYYTWLNSEGYQQNLAPTNPVALLRFKDDTSEIRRFIGNTKVDYRLHFLPELTATINIGLDKTNSHGRVITSEEMPSSNTDWEGSFTNYENESTNKLLDAYLTYDKDFNDKNNLKLVGGYSYQSFETHKFDYNSLREKDGLNPNTITKYKSVLLSYFGRANYNYDDKYLVTATLRADASSKLNPDDRWGYFPSVALAWNISNENFFNTEKINQLKLRIGYGEIGNVNGLGDYKYLTRYNKSIAGADYQLGDNYYQTYRPEPINKNLRWEVGNTLNAGIDYAFFNSRISGSINAYIKTTQDLISNVTVDPFTNFSNRIESNIGDMENKGIEFELNAIPVQTEDFTWNIGFNMALNKNEITNLPDQVEVGGIDGGTGNTVQLHKEGYSPFSFWVYKQVYNEDGKPIEGAYVDRNGDNQITEKDKYLYKDPFADITMGFNTNLNYKNWDLAVVTRASLGNYAYNNMASSRAYETKATINGILSNLHRDYYSTGFKSLTDTNLRSDYYVQDASFFKLDNITLGYTFNQIFEDSNLRVYGSAQNVLTVTDYDGLDPEIYIGGDFPTTGIDNNFYPRPRIYTIGVSLNF